MVRAMGRWEPNTLERLQQAAMELFTERGYDQCTVSEIAARAGLTERTFFRYFADKKEVLFSGREQLEAILVERIAGAPAELAPLDLATAALEATAPMFEQRRAHARKRAALIAAHAELHERELIKLAQLTDTIAKALTHRDVDPRSARLVAETSMAIFKSAFERWIADPKKHDVAHYVREARDELRAASLVRACP